MIIIGFGTGRCGTQSLASFLNQQEGFNVTHEGVKLYGCPVISDRECVLDSFMAREGMVIGDIGFYWINYISKILNKRADSKVINVTRDLDEVIESFFTYKTPDKVNLGGWYGYPYEDDTPTKDAIARTMKHYRFWEDRIKHYHVGMIYHIDMYDLNKEDKLSDMLNWIGYETTRVLSPIHIDNKRVI